MEIIIIIIIISYSKKWPNASAVHCLLVGAPCCASPAILPTPPLRLPPPSIPPVSTYRRFYYYYYFYYCIHRLFVIKQEGMAVRNEEEPGFRG